MGRRSYGRKRARSDARPHQRRLRTLFRTHLELPCGAASCPLVFPSWRPRGRLLSFPVAILGAGPAGLGAAYQLATRRLASVTVLEQRDATGGNAGSFEIDGVWADYGSHRLHPSCDPRILAALKELLGEDLLLRPRHGRIRLRERWIHFPLKPLDLMLHLPLSFSAHTFADILSKPFRQATGASPTLAALLQTSLGSTICRDFYFPYARKIWGLEPEELSATQARRRGSAGSLGKMVKNVLSIVPVFKAPGAGRFYYPKKGFGQISEVIAAEAQN